MRIQVWRIVRGAVAGALAITMVSFLPSSAQAETREPDAAEQRLLRVAEDEGPQRVLVEFTSMRQREALTREVRSKAEVFDVNHTYGRWPTVAARADAGALERLATSPGVAQVIEDVVEHDELDSAIGVTGADQVHSRGFTGSGQAVAVIDSGVSADHPFFGGRVVEEACFADVNQDDGQGATCPNGEHTQTGSGAAEPYNDHGTHVAGIAAGANPDAPSDTEPDSGVAPGADVIAIRVGSDGSTPISDSLAGFEHALDLTSDYDVAAVNYSKGGDTTTEPCEDDARADAIGDLRAAGVAVVKSAGNDDGEDGVTTPGCVPGVVAVGNTEDDDAIRPSSNRGSLLDLFAPGTDIDSSMPDGGYDSQSGTSMAAPHVAGAFALLSERFPDEGPDQLLGRLQDTGVPISYESGGEDYTTPRIDLDAAVPPAGPTDVSAGGPYETDEGAPVQLNGSGQNVNSFEWDLDNDGAFDDATGANPTFDRVGQDGTYPIALRASGPGGSATDETTVTVHNVPPTVRFEVDSPPGDPKPENSTVHVTGQVTDPGWLDPLSATINWGPNTGGTVDLEGELTNDPPQATFDFEASFDYGDNGDFTVEVCGSDDDTTRCEEATARIDNVDPTPRIDKSEAVDTPEGPTIIARKGKDVGLSATTTDPGSDDLHLAWFYGHDDAAEEPDREVSSLVNPPDADPPLSPSVQPREVTDETSTSYAKPCVYEVRHTASDDDGGTGADNVHVVVQNKGIVKRTATLWYTQYLLGGEPVELGRETLECYLDISGHMSAVFGETTPAGTIGEARDVLWLRLFADPETKLDRQLLAGWLNFAHGAFQIDDDVDSHCDLHTDATFEQALRDAETVRLDPGSTRAELREQAHRMKALNLCNPLPG